MQDCQSLLNPIIIVSFVPRSYNNAIHHMASVAAKENFEGSWNFELIDDVLKSIIMFQKHNIIHLNI